MNFDPEDLMRRAREARDRAHAPYSRYRVGAAVFTAAGRIYTGCNVENASYGLTICAERTAVFSAVANGDREIVAIAVAAPGDASMCGACRQVVREFGSDITVYLGGKGGSFRTTSIDALLPGAFDPRFLKNGGGRI